MKIQWYFITNIQKEKDKEIAKLTKDIMSKASDNMIIQTHIQSVDVLILIIRMKIMN